MTRSPRILEAAAYLLLLVMGLSLSARKDGIALAALVSLICVGGRAWSLRRPTDNVIRLPLRLGAKDWDGDDK